MKGRFLALALAFSVIGLSFAGCASNPAAAAEVKMRQQADAAIDALGVFAKGVEAAAKANPPVITIKQAHEALDITKAAVRTIKRVPAGRYEVLSAALDQVAALPFAAEIRTYIDIARLTLAAVR